MGGGILFNCLICFSRLLLFHSNLALAQMAFEDAYLTIQDVDGVEWADKLRRKMDLSVKGDKVVKANETTWLKGSGSA